MNKNIKQIPMQACDSSQVKEYGYLPDSGTLAVRFKSGGLYHYSNIPLSVIEELRKAKSVGSFLHAHVKGKYDYQRIGD